MGDPTDRGAAAVIGAEARESRVKVRPATADDAQTIAEIYNEAVTNTTATFDLETQTPDDRRRWLADETTLAALVAEVDGRVQGWSALVRWSGRRAYERTAEASIYVAPAARRSGLGLHVVIAQICTENVAGLALAERLGFERVGVLREVGFKFGRWLDVAVCQRLV